VRRLGEPKVLNSAAIAALFSVLLCYPGFALWADRKFPIFYLEMVLFVGGFILWAFVLAWHSEYTHRPVFTWNIGTIPFAVATGAGIAAAAFLYTCVDPMLRRVVPGDYPSDLKHWVAMALFGLGFGQLFFVFAPFAWLMRLFKHQEPAIAFTVLFGTAVMAYKFQSGGISFPFPQFALILLTRILLAWLSVVFYLRGGVLLALWWGLLLELRHVPTLL
jgi:hypothetical protein